MVNVKRNNPIPERKTKTVKELADLIKNNKTILIASVMNLPASQFQSIGKKLRGKAIVKVPKKNLMQRAIEDSGVKNSDELKKQITQDIAVIFSNVDSFELAADLLKNKSPAKAKAGQEAPYDIEIKAGMTELVPGPAISELGAVGLTTKVTNGKLEIIKDKIIVQKGDAISQGAADVMSKLDILPFSLGYIPVSSFHTEDGISYLEINIDTDATGAALLHAYSRALPFAVEIGYVTSDTVKLMISKAGSYEAKLIRIINGEPEPVAAPEAPNGVPQNSELGGKEASQETTTPKEEEKEKPAAAGEGLASLFG